MKKKGDKKKKKKKKKAKWGPWKISSGTNAKYTNFDGKNDSCKKSPCCAVVMKGGGKWRAMECSKKQSVICQKKK